MNPTRRTDPIDHRQAAWILTSLGILHIPLVGFHFAFPSLFQWSTDLVRLTPDNRSLFWALHLCGMFWLASMGGATLWAGIRGLQGQFDTLPRGFWLWTIGFWLFRISIQVPVDGVRADSVAMMFLLAPIAALYLVAWIKLAPEDRIATSLGLHLRPGSMLR